MLLQLACALELAPDLQAALAASTAAPFHLLPTPRPEHSRHVQQATPRLAGDPPLASLFSDVKPQLYRVPGETLGDAADPLPVSPGSLPTGLRPLRFWLVFRHSRLFFPQGPTKAWPVCEWVGGRGWGSVPLHVLWHLPEVTPSTATS